MLSTRINMSRELSDFLFFPNEENMEFFPQHIEYIL